MQVDTLPLAKMARHKPMLTNHNITPDHHPFFNIYTGCPRRNGENFGRVFLMLNYTDITQNTYIQS